MTTRRAAAIWLVLLVALLAWVLWRLVPWQPMPSAPDSELRRSFTSNQISRGDAFGAEVHLPGYLKLLAGLVVVAGLTLTRRGLALLRRVVAPARRWWVQVPMVVVLVSVVGWLVALPFALWQQSVLRGWSVSAQSWTGWFADNLKGIGLTIGVTTVALTVLVGLARLLPGWWFLPASVGAAGLTALLSFAYPVVVEPIYNNFDTMKAGELRTDLVDLARTDGVQVNDVLIADASRRSRSLNAYVSGYGSTLRIVIYDTLLTDVPHQEVEAIVAHELGHAKYRDVVTGTIIGSVGAALGMSALWWVLESGWARRRGLGGGHPLAAAVVLGLSGVLAVALLPAQNAVSRQLELRADEHALALTRDPGTVVRMQQLLAQHNLADLTPSRWSYLVFASHPSAVQRITLAREWTPDDEVGR